MDEVYRKMMKESKRIASVFGLPRFYIEHKGPLARSRNTFYENDSVVMCRNMVVRQLKDNLGHGMEHARKVTIDAGALICIEGERLSLESEEIEKAIVIVQLSGLLHDIKRREPNHARASAEEAEIQLRDFSIQEAEKQIIVLAISNHEAFVEPDRVSSPLGQLISDSLYDADKFRWGLDNFTETLWYMADFRGASIESIARNFPRGVEGIKKIKDTFRTTTGKKYGPEIIDLGLGAGEEIYVYLLLYTSSQ